MGLLSLSLVMALTLAAPELRAQDTLIVKLSLRTTDFSFGNQDGYDVINPKLDRMDRIRIPGHPQLPTWHPAYIIPYWKDIAYCEIVALDSVQIPGTWHIYPAQQEITIGDSTDWTPPDTAIYNSDSLYPGKLQDTPGSGAFDGARIANLNLYPIQYRPKSGKLFLYTNATLKLVFKDSDPPVNAKQRYEHVQEIYDKMLAILVENDGDIGAWYRRPAIIDPNGGKDLLVPAFIIITTQAQEQYIQPYVTWMWQKGYVPGVYCVEDFLPDYPGVDDAERMRNFIIDKYNNWGTSFFLLLGHERESSIPPTGIPYRKLGPIPTWEAEYDLDSDPLTGWKHYCVIPSDLYFSEVDINWNPSHPPDPPDQYWGVWNLYPDQWFPPEHPMTDINPSSIIPDIFVGRVLAYTPSFGPPAQNEVTTWVNKVLNYEQNPGNANGLTNVLYTGQETVNNLLFYEDYYPRVNGEYPDYFDDDVSFSAIETRNLINANYYGWLNNFSHGYENRGWLTDNGVFYGINYHPQPQDASVYELTNQNAYFIGYSVACYQTGYDDYPGSPWIHDTTVGEALVEAYPNRGAVAAVSNTRLGKDVHVAIQVYFLEAIFTNGLWFLGAADAYAKDGSRASHLYARYSPNLFGSPLTEVWTNTPVLTTTTVSPNRIPVNQTRSVTVTVRYFNGETYVPLSNARVTLYGCAIYRIGYTNARGQVSYTITPTQTGTIKVTATKHDYKPSQANITVANKGDMAISDDEGKLPPEFFMAITSSNPVKGALNLQYGIPLEDEGLVSLKIYDVSGRVVQTIFSEEKSAGYYDLSIPTSSFSAGAYFLRLEAGAKAKTEKIILQVRRF